MLGCVLVEHCCGSRPSSYLSCRSNPSKCPFHGSWLTTCGPSKSASPAEPESIDRGWFGRHPPLDIDRHGIRSTVRSISAGRPIDRSNRPLNQKRQKRPFNGLAPKRHHLSFEASFGSSSFDASSPSSREGGRAKKPKRKGAKSLVFCGGNEGSKEKPAHLLWIFQGCPRLHKHPSRSVRMNPQRRLGLLDFEIDQVIAGCPSSGDAQAAARHTQFDSRSASQHSHSSAGSKQERMMRFLLCLAAAHRGWASQYMPPASFDMCVGIDRTDPHPTPQPDPTQTEKGWPAQPPHRHPAAAAAVATGAAAAPRRQQQRGQAQDAPPPPPPWPPEQQAPSSRGRRPGGTTAAGAGAAQTRPRRRLAGRGRRRRRRWTRRRSCRPLKRGRRTVM